MHGCVKTFAVRSFWCGHLGVPRLPQPQGFLSLPFNNLLCYPPQLQQPLPSFYSSTSTTKTNKSQVFWTSQACIIFFLCLYRGRPWSCEMGPLVLNSGSVAFESDIPDKSNWECRNSLLGMFTVSTWEHSSPYSHCYRYFSNSFTLECLLKVLCFNF